MTANISLAGALWVLAGAAVAAPLADSPSDLATVVLDGIPHVRQKPDFCGEACVAMDLRSKGLASAGQDAVFAASALDPALGRGVWTRELKTALQNLGYDPGRVWHKVSAVRPAPGLDRLFAELHADLEEGVPSIVCTRFDEDPETTEHFRLVIGYDQDRDEIVYHDPALDDGASLRMSRERLYSLWPLKYEAKRWSVIKLPLRSAAEANHEQRLARAQKVDRGSNAAEVAQHIQALKERLPRGFSVRYVEPFVVVSNAPARMRDRALRTVRWATDQLRAHYFARDPKEIHEVYLFGDDKSYRKYAAELFGDRPDTPYGYYSETDHALIMNIATGRGTLVHEMVHPFVAANVDDAPPWLNEGLGSLYEASSSRDGRIVGTLNWRLRGLRESIRDDALPSFRTLLAMDDDRFYSDRDGGDNYAQARYLLYYLQQQGKLDDFWSDFMRNRDRDPTGIQALERALGTKDLEGFQRRWQKWVMNLRRR